MYLFIYEDGDTRKGSKVQEGDFMAADDGIFDIFDISNPLDPKRYFQGEWEKIENVDT